MLAARLPCACARRAPAAPAHGARARSLLQPWRGPARRGPALARATDALTESSKEVDEESSTDLDEESRDPRDVGMYVNNADAALHVGFSGPGWRANRDPESGRIYSINEYCGPGRVRLAFGAAAGVDNEGDAVYNWGRGGWGGDARCISGSLGDEKPRFYITARQAAQILAAPDVEHRFEYKFVGWRRDKDGCPPQGGAEREGGTEEETEMTKVLTWAPVWNDRPHGLTPPDAPRYRLELALECSDGFSASTGVGLDGADWLLFDACVRFAIPRLLGLHGEFAMPVWDDYLV